MKINIKYKIRDAIHEIYVSDPQPTVKSLTAIIKMIIETNNIVEVRLINESHI